MKITIYELLKLVNECKAPKKIKYGNEIWDLVLNPTIQGSYDYQNENNEYLILEMLKASYLTDVLKDEVEIIEEDKKIEFLHYHNADNELEYNGRMYKMRVLDKAFVEKIDELIEEINKLKEVK